MIIFPRPRLLYLAALALAIPTYGVSIAVFYFGFKRPYDSRAASLILSKAKSCIQTGRGETLSNVNRAAIERVFSKFSVPEQELRCGVGVPFVRWGVLRHPMINDGQTFTLRIIREGGNLTIEAGKGEAWWLLQDPSEDIGSANSRPTYTDESTERFWALIKRAAQTGEQIELRNLKYEAFANFAERDDHYVDEYFSDYRGMRFWRDFDDAQYYVEVRTIEPAQMGESGVLISSHIVGPRASN